MKSDLKNYCFVLIAGMLWGTIGLFVKLMEAYGSSSAYTSFIRLLFGCVLLLGLTLATDGMKGFKVSKRTLISCFLLGLICQGIYNLCYSMSVSKNGMSMASVLLYTSPIFTCITARLLFGEKLTRRKLLALFVNIFGCILTVTGGSFHAASLGLMGLLLGLGAGFTYSLSAVFGRLATDDHASPYAIAAYNFLFGSLFLGLCLRPWNTVKNPFDIRILGCGLLFALIPTAIGYTFYFYGISKVKETGRIPVLCSVELVVATIIGLAVFGEAIGGIHVMGILLVLCSILLFS